MASRPVFIPSISADPVFVVRQDTEFTWFPGMAKSQKQKSIRSLHESAEEQWQVRNALEISSKSETQLGTALSAFFLKVELPNGQQIALENAFQGSKVFEDGGPYTDLFEVTPLESKRDPRIRQGGPLQAFEFFGERWPLDPQTVFYDWLYVNAVAAQPRLAELVVQHDAFTDIEFNPKKSINCQAYSAALFCALWHSDLLSHAQSGSSFRALVDKLGTSSPLPQLRFL